VLGIAPNHATAVAGLPWHHRDPFDRLLVSQALIEEMVIVSADESFDADGVQRLW
jgi:PIN domain nuclease of toxin-antitoxin system